jgi:hypothetical protein
MSWAEEFDFIDRKGLKKDKQKDWSFKVTFKLNMAVHTSVPNTSEVELGGSWVWHQSGLHSKSLSQKTKNRKQTKKILLL